MVTFAVLAARAFAPEPAAMPMTLIVYVPGRVPRSVHVPQPVSVLIPQTATRAISSPLIPRRLPKGRNRTAIPAMAGPANGIPALKKYGVEDPQSCGAIVLI